MASYSSDVIWVEYCRNLSSYGKRRTGLYCTIQRDITTTVEVVNILLCFLHRLELTIYRLISLKIENIFFLPVCVCVVISFILDVRFVDVLSGGHTGGRSHRTSVWGYLGGSV